MLAELWTAMAGVWGGKRSSVKTATSMGCQWDANGMLMECQWNAKWGANGRVFGSSAKFFLLKFVFVPISAILLFFLSTPFFFYYSFSFYFFFLPSLLLSSGISIAIRPSYCYISTFVVKSIRLRTSRRSSSRRSLSVFPSQNRPCDHWLLCKQPLFPNPLTIWSTTHTVGLIYFLFFASRLGLYFLFVSLLT